MNSGFWHVGKNVVDSPIFTIHLLHLDAIGIIIQKE